MALWHDLAARMIRSAHPPSQRPSGEAMTAETEAGPVRVWAYRGAEAGTAPPVYLHFSDTGFIAPAAGRDDPLARALAEALDAVVLLADLPLAPADRFPKTPARAQALAWWAMLAGRTQGWNGKRLALGGRGTGAGLAVGACLELPARMAVKPVGLVALNPVLDLTTAMGWRERLAIAAYLPDVPARAAPLASPLHAPDESLAALPPSLILTEETDPRRAESTAFATRLEAAGRTAHRASSAAERQEITLFLAETLAGGA